MPRKKYPEEEEYGSTFLKPDEFDLSGEEEKLPQKSKKTKQSDDEDDGMGNGLFKLDDFDKA